MNARFLRVLLLLSVGGLFLQGVTSCQDRIEQQRKFFEKTLSKAEKGDVEAQTLVGGFYLNGAQKDYPEALKWYRRAADQGYAGAQFGLGLMYYNGKGVEKDYAEAAKWYRKSADQGDVRAQLDLAKMYRSGEGVKKDYAEALKLLKKPLDMEYSEARFCLGLMYYNGEGAGKNYPEALKLFRKAADRGVADAEFYIGVMYCNGEGVEKNYVEAYVWWDVAASRGNEMAAKKRSELEGKMSPQQIADAQRRSAKLKQEIQDTVGYK